MEPQINLSATKIKFFRYFGSKKLADAPRCVIICCNCCRNQFHAHILVCHW